MAKATPRKSPAKTGKTAAELSVTETREYLDAHITGERTSLPCPCFTPADLSRELRQLAIDAGAGTYMAGFAGDGYLVKLAKRVKIIAAALNPQLARALEPEKCKQLALPNGKTQRLPAVRRLTTGEDRLSHLCWQASGAAGFFSGERNRCNSKAEALEHLQATAAALDGGAAEQRAGAQQQDASTVIPNTPVTLREFMEAYCVPLPTKALLTRRVESLKNAAESGKVELPPHVTPWKRGQPHKYRPSALTTAWPRLKTYLPDIPDTRDSCNNTTRSAH